MTTPDPKATLPSGKIIIEEAPFDGAHHGRVDGDWRPVAEEAPADNKQYARQNGGWSEVTAEGVDFGIGLSKDETAAPPIVHLQPAGDSPATLGGVYVVDRVRNVEEGLELGIDGRLRAPLATDSLAGTILEPPPDDRGYVRRRDPTGVSQWVPPATTTGPDFGTGLALDDPADPADPQVVNLTPAGDAPQFLGGVYVVDRVRNVEEGLELGIDGRLRAPLATDSLAGTLLEPPPDDRGYVRARSAAGVSAWVPPADTPGYDYGTGLSVDRTPVPPDQPIVNLTPAGPLPQHLGGVYVPPRDDTLKSGLTIDMGNEALGDPATGELLAPPASDLLLGTLTEPPPDGMAYSRQWDNVTDPANPKWVWVPALTAGLQITSIIPDKAIYGPSEPLLTVHAYGSEFTNTCVIRVDGVDAQTGYVSETELTFVLNPAVPISEQFHIITVHETAPTPVDGLGAEQFDFIVASIAVDYGKGLSFDTSTDPPIVNLDPAGPTNLGGVKVSVRDATTQGLQIDFGDAALGDPATGELWAPPATPDLLGTITEPPADAKGYVRTTQLDGTSQWVPPAPSETLIAGNAPKDLGSVYVPARNDHNQGLDLNGDGGLYAPPATHEHLGTLLEPPEENKQYARFRDPTTHNNQWVEVEGGMEEPPMEPVQTWGRSSGGVRGWLPLPDPGDTIEEPPMEPVQTWGRSSGGARGWLPLPDGGVEAGRGLSKTDDPATLHLEIATQNALGGVIIAPVPGLAIDQTGNLTLERASPTDLGGIVDAPYDDAQPTKSYSRRWGEWVPTEPGGMDEPPADPVALWGRSSAGARGWLEVPTFDHLTGFVEKIGDTMQGFLTLHDNPIEPFHAATRSWVELEVQLKVDEPPNDDIAYARKWKEWVPVAGSEAGRGLTADGTTLHLDIATQTDLGGVFIPPQQGLEITQVGGLTLARATPEDIGGLVDAPRDDTGTKQYARKWGQWVETDAGIADAPPDFVYGRTAQRWIQLNDDGTYPAGSILYVQVNGDTMRGSLMLAHEGALAMEAVTVSQLERLRVDAGVGLIQIGPRIDLRPATEIEIGGIYEAPDDGVAYVRQFGQWEKLPPGQTPLLFRYGLVQTNDIVDVKPATNGSDPASPPELGGVYATKRDDNQGLVIDSYGHISVPLATDLLAGSIVEPPPDAKGYVRTTQLDGTSQWVPPAASTLDEPPPDDRGYVRTTHLDGTSQWVPPALPPLATPDEPGLIEEPVADAKGYVRTTQLDGTSQWVPPAPSAGGVTISDTPPVNPAHESMWWESDTGDLFIFYEDPSGPPGQWVQVNGESAPPSVHVADDPPMSPTENQLWWDSNAGTLNIWYSDADSSQWVQVAAPQIPGVPEAPIDGVPYSRRDANWVATTSLAATPGDVKNGLQVNDHGGWIKMDGRLVNTLTTTQQAQAALLGLTTNIPNATGTVLMQNGTAMGAVAGNMAKTIAHANLPAVNLTANNAAVLTTSQAAATPATTNNALGFSDNVGYGALVGQAGVGGTGYWFVSCGGEGGATEYRARNYDHSHSVTVPAHSHTVPAHNHTIPLGGSGTPLDCTPKSLSTNVFLFLGA